MIRRIISGGQTGVDIAALDIAGSFHLARGGWCPKGRRCEVGVIPPCYELRETPSSSYLQRTEWNVRDSDFTLVLYRVKLEGGSLATADYATKLGRPHRCVDLMDQPDPEGIAELLSAVITLNVAGTRASKAQGIWSDAYWFLHSVIQIQRIAEMKAAPQEKRPFEWDTPLKAWPA